MTEEKKEEKNGEDIMIGKVKGPHELMLCQTDAYVKKIDALVVECAEHVVVGSKQKKKKNKKTLYKVRLSDTVLFPEGGGQPADRGTIDGHDVKHVYRDCEGLVFHVLESPIEVKKVVEVVLDFTFRLYVIQMSPNNLSLIHTHTHLQ